MNTINVLMLIFGLSNILVSSYLQITQGGFYFLVLFLSSFAIIFSMLSVSLDYEQLEGE